MTAKTMIHFLFYLSIFNLCIWGFGLLIEKLQTHTKQKVLFYKFSIILSIVFVTSFGILSLLPTKVIRIDLMNPVMEQVTNPISNVVARVSPTWFEIALNIYVSILLVQFLWMLFSYWKFAKGLKKASVVDFESIKLFLIKEGKGPFCFGVFEPKIYIPENLFNSLDKRSLRSCVIHERNHCESFDPFWKLTSLLIRAVLFFSPISYLLHKKIDLELEKYCDYQTLLDSSIDVSCYGNMLLDLVTNQNGKQINFSLNIEGSTIKRRIVEMKSRKKVQRPFFNAIICFFCLVIGVTTAFAASGKSDQKMYSISGRTLVNDKESGKFELRIREGEKFAMVLPFKEGKELITTLVASDREVEGQSEKGILIALDMKHESEEGKFHIRPKVVTASGKEALFTINDNHNEEIFEMKIVAKRL